MSHDGSNAAIEGRSSNIAISQDQIVKKKNDSEDKFANVNSENEVGHEIFNAVMEMKVMMIEKCLMMEVTL